MQGIWFRTREYDAGVVWAGEADSIDITLPEKIRVLDIMETTYPELIF